MKLAKTLRNPPMLMDLRACLRVASLGIMGPRHTKFQRLCRDAVNIYACCAICSAYRQVFVEKPQLKIVLK